MPETTITTKEVIPLPDVFFLTLSPDDPESAPPGTLSVPELAAQYAPWVINPAPWSAVHVQCSAALQDALGPRTATLAAQVKADIWQQFQDVHARAFALGRDPLTLLEEAELATLECP